MKKDICIYVYKGVKWGTIFNNRKLEQSHVFVNSKLIKSAMMYPHHKTMQQPKGMA